MENNKSIFEGNLRKAFAKLAIPSIIGMLIISSQIMIDGLFISNFIGSDGLAGINLVLPFMNLQFGIVIMISVGGAVLASTFKGKGEQEKSNEIFSLTFYTYVISTIFISILAHIFKEKIIYFLGANDKIFDVVNDYLGIIIIYSLFLNLPIVLEAFMRIDEKANLIVISGISGLITNIIMNYILIIKFGFALKGAAYGSVIAGAVSGSILFYNLIIKGENFYLAKIKIDWISLRNIIYNGSSEMFTILSSAISGYVLNLLLMKRIGELGVSAMTIVLYSSVYVNIVLVGLSQALQPIVSYNVGAKKIDKIKEALKLALIIGAGIGVSAYMIMSSYAVNIIELFAKNNIELKNLALEITGLFIFAYLFSFINVIISTFHTAIEKPVESSVIATSRALIFVLIFLLVLPIFMGDKGLWLATPLAEVMSVIISLILLNKSYKELKLKLVKA